MAVDVEFLNGNSINNIDTNFQRVKTALQETLGRGGDLPNQMNVDLDMDSNDILNVGTLQVEDITIDGEDPQGILERALAAVVEAEAAAVVSDAAADDAEAAALEAANYASLARNDWLVVTFTGDGTTTVYTLPIDPGTVNNTIISLAGVVQEKISYTLTYPASVPTITFSEAPPVGVKGEILYGYTIGVNTPADGSVTTAKVADDAITFAKTQDIATARILGRVTASSGDIEELTAAQLRDAFLPSGSVVDSVYSEYVANADLSTVIPVDDTIPQITEGVQILSAVITPKSTTNKLRVRFQGQVAHDSTPGGVTVAFFDGASNAIAATYIVAATSDTAYELNAEFEYVPGVTTAKTITARVGPSGAGSVRFNGSISEGRIFGGTSRATLVVEEIKG